MVDNADTHPAATGGPARGEDAGVGTAPTGQDTGGAPAPGSPDYQAQIDELRSGLGDQTKRYRDLQGHTTRVSQENALLKAQLQARSQAQTQQPPVPQYPDNGTGYEDQGYQALQAQLNTTAQQLAATQLESATANYRTNNPNWADYSDEVSDILNDPVRIPKYAVYNADGSVNFSRTIEGIHMNLENRDMRKSRNEAVRVKAETDAQKARQKAQATISGVGGVETDQGFDPGDLKGKSAQEIADAYTKAGLVSASDPPKFD